MILEQTGGARVYRPFPPVDTPYVPELRSKPPTVLQVGPSPEQLGGMATVLGQILSLDFGPRFGTRLHATTSATASTESLFSRLVRHLKHLRSLRTAIVHNNVAIVHIHTCSGFSFYRSLLDQIVAKTCGCRVVLHVHGAAFDTFFDQSNPLARRIIQSGLSSADRVIALSDGWRAKLTAMTPSARITVIENAVELPNPPPAERNSARGPCHFVQLSKMDTWKGIDDLILACEILQKAECDFRVSLAGPPGSAGDAALLEQKIGRRNLEDRVRYVGPVVGADKDRLLRQADVFILPSHHEGMPIAALEAMAYGLPIVATRVGALPEIMNEGELGMLVEPRNPSELAATMMEALRHPDRRAKMGAAAYEIASRRFGLDRMSRQLVELYQDLAAVEGVADHGRMETAPT